MNRPYEIFRHGMRQAPFGPYALASWNEGLCFAFWKERKMGHCKASKRLLQPPVKLNIVKETILE